MKHNLKYKAIALAMALFTLSACNNEKAPKSDTEIKISGQTMGTFFSVTLPNGYKDGAEVLEKKAHEAFSVVIDAISTFDSNSELSKFNALQDTSKFEISDYLAKNIEECIYQAHKIEDSMDITIGPLVNLWGFGPDGRLEKKPSDSDILKAKENVGYDKFAIYHENKKAYLQKILPGVKLDMSTVGEGMGADLLAQKLDKEQVNDYLIAVAGAIRSKGLNKKGQNWVVGIEDPKGNGVFERVCPKGMAMSTAGSYRNFFVDKDNNQFFSHIIDPKTAAPVAHKTVSVTVIGNSATQTDALDTGLLVLGAKKAIEFGNKYNVAVYAIEILDDGKPHKSYSKAFEPYLKCEIK